MNANDAATDGQSPFFRKFLLVFAIGLSVTVLPVAWVRVVGRAAVLGFGRSSALAWLLGALILIGVCSRQGLNRAGRIGWTWVGLVVSAFSLMIARTAYAEWQLWASPIWLLTLLALAAWHVLWLAWMWSFPGSWQRRLATLGALWLAVLPFQYAFAFIGLSGSGGTMVGWRHESPDAVTPPTQVGSIDRAPTATAQATDASGLATSAPTESSPQFLGPERSGVIAAHELTEWTTQTPQVLWTKSVGAGWGSFSVDGPLAYTMEQLGAQESTVAYRLADGQIEWTYRDDVCFDHSAAGRGPRTTPAVAGDLLVTIGATGRMNGLDKRDGTKRWSVDLNTHQLPHGTSSSPLIVGKVVYACPVTSDDTAGPSAGSGPALAAYDLPTGRWLWSAGTARASYASPQYWDGLGTPQVLLFYGGRLESFAASTGESLWHFDWSNTTDTYASQPVIQAGAENQILLTTGYSTGGVLLAIDPPLGDGPWTVRELWTCRQLETKFSTPLIRDDTIYALDNEILVAVDLATGQRRWKAGRYGYGQLLRIGRHLIVQSERGFVALVDADPSGHHERGRIEVLNGKTWNVPTVAWPYLLLRNDQQAACLKLNAP